jgi:Leucine-rich repeat (LRR) protein
LAELLTTTSGLANGEEGVEVQHCFPCLHDLVISDCPKLVLKPYFPPSLQRLTLEGRNEQLLSSGCFFHAHHASHAPGNEASPSLCIADVIPRHITQLKLGRMTESSSGWEVMQHLTGLYDLEISGCKDLKQLPDSMRGLTSLRRLDLKRCDNLWMLPEWLGELQSLQYLGIQNLPALSVFPESMQQLTSLRYLAILRTPALTHLPESMGRLTSLRFLNLACCDALTQLPESLGELSALRRLWIQNCSGFTSLPRFIGRLTALEYLMIRNCPELLRRCREGVGEDWHLISHIPDLELWD